jgi:MFS family permease
MLVLDELIVNTALPHVQRALGFSGTGLELVVTGYAITFGGLLLLGGRAGDILGRRRMFIVGVAAFSLASLSAGLATTAWWGGLAYRLALASGVSSAMVFGAGAAIGVRRQDLPAGPVVM